MDEEGRESEAVRERRGRVDVGKGVYVYVFVKEVFRQENLKFSNKLCMCMYVCVCVCELECGGSWFISRKHKKRVLKMRKTAK